MGLCSQLCGIKGTNFILIFFIITIFTLVLIYYPTHLNIKIINWGWGNNYIKIFSSYTNTESYIIMSWGFRHTKLLAWLNLTINDFSLGFFLSLLIISVGLYQELIFFLKEFLWEIFNIKLYDNYFLLAILTLIFILFLILFVDYFIIFEFDYSNVYPKAPPLPPYYLK